jgi:hypothetical protein
MTNSNIILPRPLIMQKAIQIVQIITASSYIILPRPLIMQFKCGFERPTNAKSSLAQSVKHLARV